MKIYTLNNAARELARWRESLRAPDAGAPAAKASVASEFPGTEWPSTDWADTLPGSAAWSGPNDPNDAPPR